tara:strand:- start:276 stop:791 length:516 start_codon:yes stop_codon:yes gene_type:complete
MIDIQDNFLESQQFFELQKALCEGEFPWYWQPNVAYDIVPEELLECDRLDNWQFAHMLYWLDCPQSAWYKKARILLDAMQPNINALIRVKANCNPVTVEPIEHGYHTDMKDTKSTSAIFYLNTNNGCTKFLDGTKVDCVANRLVIFPNTMEHTGVTCTDKKNKIVININYF